MQTVTMLRVGSGWQHIVFGKQVAPFPRYLSHRQLSAGQLLSHVNASTEHIAEPEGYVAFGPAASPRARAIRLQFDTGMHEIVLLIV